MSVDNPARLIERVIAAVGEKETVAIMTGATFERLDSLSTGGIPTEEDLEILERLSVIDSALQRIKSKGINGSTAVRWLLKPVNPDNRNFTHFDLVRLSDFETFEACLKAYLNPKL